MVGQLRAWVESMKGTCTWVHVRLHMTWTYAEWLLPYMFVNCELWCTLNNCLHAYGWWIDGCHTSLICMISTRGRNKRAIKITMLQIHNSIQYNMKNSSLTKNKSTHRSLIRKLFCRLQVGVQTTLHCCSCWMDQSKLNGTTHPLTDCCNNNYHTSHVLHDHHCLFLQTNT